jgi:hypothetical protein
MTAVEFTCKFCGTTTRHPDDVSERYCPVCHVFVEDVVRATEELGDALLERLVAGTGFTVPRIQRPSGMTRA